MNKASSHIKGIQGPHLDLRTVGVDIWIHSKKLHTKGTFVRKLRVKNHISSKSLNQFSSISVDAAASTLTMTLELLNHFVTPSQTPDSLNVHMCLGSSNLVFID